MGLSLVTAPAIEPVTLSEAKAHLRVEHTNEDALILGLIQAAREYAEVYCNRALLTQTWDLTLDYFPACGFIELPKPILQSITSITYKDTAGDTQTWATSNYIVDTKGVFGRITPAYGIVWPSTQSIINAVTVRFVAGYGDDTDSVPQSIKQGILMYVADLYDGRQSSVIGVSVSPAPTTAQMLMNSERVVRFV